MGLLLKRSEALLIAPHLDGHVSGWRGRLFKQRCHTVPSVLAVEPRRALVANRASEPCRLDAGCPNAFHSIREQESPDSRPSGTFAHVEVVHQRALDYVESKRRPEWFDDPHT